MKARKLVDQNTDSPPPHVLAGRTLARWREERGLSQNDACHLVWERTGLRLSTSHLSSIETGRLKRPGRDYLLALMEAYDIPWERQAELLSLYGYAPPPQQGQPSVDPQTVAHLLTTSPTLVAQVAHLDRWEQMVLTRCLPFIKEMAREARSLGQSGATAEPGHKVDASRQD